MGYKYYQCGVLTALYLAVTIYCLLYWAHALIKKICACIDAVHPGSLPIRCTICMDCTRIVFVNTFIYSSLAILQYYAHFNTPCKQSRQAINKNLLTSRINMQLLHVCTEYYNTISLNFD